MSSVVVFKREEFAVYEHIVTAHCFIFPSLPLTEIPISNAVARPARIVVSDAPAKMHYHRGFTIGFVAEGGGYIVTPESDLPIQAGDVILVPPGALHASRAEHGSTLVEYTVFIGDPDDFDAIEEG